MKNLRIEDVEELLEWREEIESLEKTLQEKLSNQEPMNGTPQEFAEAMGDLQRIKSIIMRTVTPQRV